MRKTKRLTALMLSMLFMLFACLCLIPARKAEAAAPKKLRALGVNYNMTQGGNVPGKKTTVTTPTPTKKPSTSTAPKTSTAPAATQAPTYTYDDDDDDYWRWDDDDDDEPRTTYNPWSYPTPTPYVAPTPTPKPYVPPTYYTGYVKVQVMTTGGTAVGTNQWRANLSGYSASYSQGLTTFRTGSSTSRPSTAVINFNPSSGYRVAKFKVNSTEYAAANSASVGLSTSSYSASTVQVWFEKIPVIYPAYVNVQVMTDGGHATMSYNASISAGYDDNYAAYKADGMQTWTAHGLNYRPSLAAIQFVGDTVTQPDGTVLKYVVDYWTVNGVRYYPEETQSANANDIVEFAQDAEHATTIKIWFKVSDESQSDTPYINQPDASFFYQI